MQVLAVYLIMWLPSMITIWVTDARFPGGNYVTFFGGMWSHVQAALDLGGFTPCSRRPFRLPVGT